MNFLVTILLRHFRVNENPSAFRREFSMLVLLLAGFSIHVLYLIYFFIIGLSIFVLINVFSLIFYTIAAVVNSRKNNNLAGIIAITEVTLYAVISTLLLGSTIHSQCIIIVAFIPPYLMMDLSKSQKIFLSLMMMVALNFCTFAHLFFEPPFPQYENMFLIMVNVNLVLICVFAELCVNQLIARVLEVVEQSKVEKLKTLSYVDSLTNLKNRHYANVFFEELILGRFDYDQFLFVMIDIDNFKNVNDTFGHDNGDKVLESLAVVLLKSVRQGDLICRWGGEEFLIVMCGCSIEAGINAMEGVRKTVEALVCPSEKGDIKYTITAGLSPFIDNNVKTTMEACDHKLYEGKNSGKNKVVG